MEFPKSKQTRETEVKKVEARNTSNHLSIKTKKANLRIQLMTEGGVMSGRVSILHLISYLFLLSLSLALFKKTNKFNWKLTFVSTILTTVLS